jgi:hypothetical protein
MIVGHPYRSGPKRAPSFDPPSSISSAIALTLNSLGIAMIVTRIVAPPTSVAYRLAGPIYWNGWWLLVGIVWFVAGVGPHVSAQSVYRHNPCLGGSNDRAAALPDYRAAGDVGDRRGGRVLVDEPMVIAADNRQG